MDLIEWDTESRVKPLAIATVSARRWESRLLNAELRAWEQCHSLHIITSAIEKRRAELQRLSLQYETLIALALCKWPDPTVL